MEDKVVVNFYSCSNSGDLNQTDEYARIRLIASCSEIVILMLLDKLILMYDHQQIDDDSTVPPIIFFSISINTALVPVKESFIYKSVANQLAEQNIQFDIEDIPSI